MAQQHTSAFPFVCTSTSVGAETVSTELERFPHRSPCLARPLQAYNASSDVALVPERLGAPAVAWRDQCRGFTLIEMMATMAIAMVLMTMAVPNFVPIINDNRLAVQANDLVAALALARSQAYSRRCNVVVCKSSDQENCSTNQVVEWEDGWIVFVDQNNNRTKQDNEIILRRSSGLHGENTLRPDAVFSNYIAFVADGRSIGNGSTEPPTQGRFTLCDSRGAEHARVVEISPIGRARADPDAIGTCPQN
jgi:type IV fimbrial biogenesis protein FimT